MSTIHQQVMNGSAAVKKHESEKNGLTMRFDVFVTGYALRQAWYGFVFGTCASALIFVARAAWLFVDVQVTPVVITSLLSGGVFGGGAGMVFLYKQNKQYIGHATEYERTVVETPQAEPARQQNLVRWNGEARDKGRSGKFVGKVEFTGKNLDDLDLWYLQGVDSIRRDPHGDKPGFTNLTNPFNTATFHAAKAALFEEKLIDEHNKWTAAGVAFIKDE